MRKKFVWFMLLCLCIGSAFVAWHFFRYDGKADLDFMVSEIQENHPGPYNDADPGFGVQLQHAAAVAQSALGVARSIHEQQEVLTAFARSFNDGHLGIAWHNNQQTSSGTQVTEKVFKYEAVEPSVHVVVLPTFHELTENQKAAFSGILEWLPTVRASSWIIFDIRGNRGGDSMYGTRVLEALFGEEYVHYCQYQVEAGQTVDWRASVDNLAHVERLYALTGYSSLQVIMKEMERSLREGKPFASIPACEASVVGGEKPPVIVSAKIACLIDRCNASAALDFIDGLMALKYPVLLCGETTNSDRLYMEVRSVPLPSGRGTFVHPVKVYRNRPRGDAVPYVPELLLPGGSFESVVRALQK